MGVFAETLRALAPLFLLMLVGVAARRAGAIAPSHLPIMNGLVVNVTLPALVVINIAGAPSVPAAALWLPLALFLCECIVAALSFGLARALRWDGPRTGAALLTSTFGNTGFLAYPITLALFPRQFTINILADAIGMGMVLYSTAPLIGSIFADKSADTDPQSDSASSANFFRSPVFAAIIAGVALRLLPWPDAVRHNVPLHAIGLVAGKCLGYLGQATVPLILLSLGASLVSESARQVAKSSDPSGMSDRSDLPVSPQPQPSLKNAPSFAMPTIFKLAVMPALMWLILRLLGVSGDALTVGVMIAGMPSGVMSSVFASCYNLDGAYAVKVVFITTVLSAFTLPFWILVAR